MPSKDDGPPADPYLCSFNWNQNRIADRLQVNRNDLYHWQIITHPSTWGELYIYVYTRIAIVTSRRETNPLLLAGGSVFLRYLPMWTWTSVRGRLSLVAPLRGPRFLPRVRSLLCQPFCLIYNGSAGGRANKLTNAKTNIIHRFELSLQYNEISLLFVSPAALSCSFSFLSALFFFSFSCSIYVLALVRLLFSGRHRAAGSLNGPDW